MMMMMLMMLMMLMTAFEAFTGCLAQVMPDTLKCRARRLINLSVGFS